MHAAQRNRSGDPASAAALWAIIVAGSSIVFSLAFACVTPFAAISTIAGSKMAPRQALVLTGFAWLANQAVGYLVLGYPRTAESLGWGAAIGVAALLATAAVLAIWSRPASPIATIICGFCAAFAVYEIVLFAATAVLPSGSDAFSFGVIMQILWTNVLALVGLFVLRWLAVGIGLLSKDVNEKATGYT